MKHLYTTYAYLALILATSYIQAQTINGTLKQNANQVLSLTGFDYYNANTIATTTADSLGNFSFKYPKAYKGMGIISNKAGQRLVVILDGNTTTITGTHLQEPDSLIFKNSEENTLFAKVSKQFMLHDKAYVGWDYLKKIYELDYFKKQKKQKKQVQKALQYIEEQNNSTLAQLPNNSYIYWYAAIRKLVSDMPQTVNNYPRRLPQNIQVFRATDLANPKFKTSGIFKDYIEGHYLLLENMGQPLDSVYKQMAISTDYIIDNLNKGKDQSLIKRISQELFTYFEKRSLFPAAAYLSETLIDMHPKLIDANLRSKMERYVSLKVGSTAPDITLSNMQKLSSINNNILLVFGSSECSHCQAELKTLQSYYSNWQQSGKLVVVYISLDVDKDSFSNTYTNVPWLTYCDFKGWDTPAAKAYFVNATPTYFLLDKDLKILLHPRSLEHVDAWVKLRL